MGGEAGPAAGVLRQEGRNVFDGGRDNSLTSFIHHLTSHHLRNKYGCTYLIELLGH